MASLPDDWLMEIETLQAVFMDQIKQKEDGTVLEITLWPNPDAKDDSENHVGLSFEVTLKKDYPNSLPDMMVRPLKGVTTKQARELLEKLEAEAKEMVGMQMLYPLAQMLKDWLDEQNMDTVSKQKEAARAKDELEIEKEREEYARRHKDGTPVTVENFKVWWTGFLAAHPEKPQWNPDAIANNNNKDAASSSNSGSTASVKLTGKQLFERGALANVDVESLIASAEKVELNASSSSTDNPVAAPSGASSGAKVDWTLFADEGDLPDEEDL